MIKRTLYFGSPAYLKVRHQQLVIELPGANGLDAVVGNTVPIEDIGLMVIDHNQVTYTSMVLQACLANNVAFVQCDERHLPCGLFTNLDGNTLLSARYKVQIEASKPLKKLLWAQTVKAKISNQAQVLRLHQMPYQALLRFAAETKSGDPDNFEGRAAAHYWKHLFNAYVPNFKRDRDGLPPNAWLNYGYAILRAIIARSIVGSGLMPALGIFHRNQYNAFCLADDLMEPYRPFIDVLVLNLLKQGHTFTTISKPIKEALLGIPVIDVYYQGQSSPLMVFSQRTTASLVRCYEGEQRKIIYPELTHGL